MFEAGMVIAFAAALIPPLYLLGNISFMKDRVEQALGALRNSDEQMRTLVATQRDLVDSFAVFDSLLACLQHSGSALSTTARAFIGGFRERATAYVERGCEGSLLSTHIREDRLKQLAMKLAQEHKSELAHRTPLRLDALDNGDFAEYLKLLKYLVHRHLSDIVNVPHDQADFRRLSYGA